MSASSQVVIATISALGAVGAAIGAFWSANATRKAAEARLLLSFLESYSDPEMLQALRELRQWRADKAEDFAKKWRAAMDALDTSAQVVDRARRKVKGYFFHALRLYEAGYTSEHFLREVASVDGVNILYDIVEPLERALNPEYDKERFQRIRDLCGRARTGRLIRLVPIRPRDKK